MFDKMNWPKIADNYIGFAAKKQLNFGTILNINAAK